MVIYELILLFALFIVSDLAAAIPLLQLRSHRTSGSSPNPVFARFLHALIGANAFTALSNLAGAGAIVWLMLSAPGELDLRRRQAIFLVYRTILFSRSQDLTEYRHAIHTPTRPSQYFLLMPVTARVHSVLQGSQSLGLRRCGFVKRLGSLGH